MNRSTTNGLPRTVLIANRGEIVARIARTCRSMGIRTVAVASAVDALALHTRTCDEVVVIGGASPADSYLRVDLLLDAARRCGADAVHPGYGFLAEDARFAQAVIDAGLCWIGPSPEVIATMGDKLAAKRRMAAAGVPVVAGAALALNGAEQGDPGAAEPGARDAADDRSSPAADARTYGAVDVEVAETPSEGGALGNDGAIDPARIRALAEELGLPLLVKAAAGGGGKGMRAVHHLDAVVDAVASASREAAAGFGDGRVFLERLVERPRHVEVQVLGDEHGRLVHLFERECSIQRRHQKVLEESPSPGIDEEVRRAILAAATTAAAAIGYTNAGTVEFVVDDRVLARRAAGETVAVEDAFAFLEVNTRLQVEHPVTEEVVRRRDPVTGALERIDLVREQLLIAAGLPLSFTQDELVTTGHAIEVRLYAEDPSADDLPGAGALPVFDPAGGDGVRWEIGVEAGEQIPSHYDPMLAKVIAAAPSRLEAAARLARALQDTALVGVPTNLQLLIALLRDVEVLAGGTTTGLLADRRMELLEAGRPSPAEIADAALVAAVVELVRGAQANPVPGVPLGFTNAGSLEPVVAFVPVGEAGDRAFVVTVVGTRDGRLRAAVQRSEAPWAIDRDGPEGRAAALDAAGWREVEIRSIDAASSLSDRIDGQVRIAIDGRARLVRVVDAGDGRVQVLGGERRVTLRRVERFPLRVPDLVAGASVAPMPGTVIEVAVEVGDEVHPGQRLATVEAMKTEHRITAEVAGRVMQRRVGPGDQVDADDVIVVIEPAEAADPAPE